MSWTRSGTFAGIGLLIALAAAGCSQDSSRSSTQAPFANAATAAGATSGTTVASPTTGTSPAPTGTTGTTGSTGSPTGSTGTTTGSTGTTTGSTGTTTGSTGTTTGSTGTTTGSTGSTGSTGTPGSTPPAPPAPFFRVSGWLPYWAYASGDRTIAATVGHGLDEVNLFGYSLRSDGSLVARSGVEDPARWARIRNLGGEIIPTVFDVDDGPALATVLASQAAQDRCVTEIVDRINRHGYDGIDLDFEHATSANRAAFTRFVNAIGAAVKARGKVFSVTLPGKRSDTSWAGYDYAGLAANADRVKIMCYGYSGPWSRTPGPIAPSTWITRVLDYAATTMPLSKVQVGIPFYGYDWPANGGTIRSVTSWSSVQSRLQQSTTGVRFDATYQEATFTYTDSAGVSHTVWFQDERSIAAKCAIARQRGCQGVAIWALGYGDDTSFFAAIRRELGKP